MLATKTPLRVSLFGGGTDIPNYFNHNGGQVTGFTINKYIYIFASKIDIYQGFKFRLSYRDNEDVKDFNDIKHPIFRELIRLYNFQERYHFSTMSCLPSGAGLGSSSSFTVGLIFALNSIMGINETKVDIAKKAIHIERNILNEDGGWQDQLHAAYGGFNTFKFKDNKISHKPVEINSSFADDLNDSMYILHTGITRRAKNIEKSKTKNDNENLLKYTNDLAIEGERILNNKSTVSLNEIGALLNEGWKLKRELSDKVSNEDIDSIYKIIMSNGAYGAKLCGAGGGGFFLVLSNNKSILKIRERLPSSAISKINIDYNGVQEIKI